MKPTAILHPYSHELISAAIDIVAETYPLIRQLSTHQAERTNHMMLVKDSRDDSFALLYDPDAVQGMSQHALVAALTEMYMVYHMATLPSCSLQDAPSKALLH